MPKYFQPIIEQLSQRSAEATLSILGITDPDLRHFLSEQFNRPVGGGDNFLADPVFEAIFGWEQANIKMERLAGSLLERSLIEAMDKPPRELAADYAFRKEWFPYQHQLRAWQELSKTNPKSIVITSGTGSGKTECFMVPVLNDLVRQYESSKHALIGVQALFIYPLNALINSQRDRLRAWTHSFGSNIRFCLYNGNTKETVQAKVQAEAPNEILSRTLLRSEPPPLLVTNSTMLEYMLVRQADAPILEKSQGKLRWIILDEAHTYIGSQAAELSLLLRRVMHGFGVKASDVRFVATSATIGDKDNDQLRQYLASLAGISIDQVSVIGGRRDIPDLSKTEGFSGSRHEIEQLDSDLELSERRYKMLVSHATSRKLRKYLTHDNLPKSLNQISHELFGNSWDQKTQHNEALAWLDLCSGTVDGKTKQPFLPIRGHVFHQVINGLWCCVDSACKEKKGTALEQNWPFGLVYSQRKTLCNCGAPVYELIFCNDCNAPHLQAIESKGRLVQMPRELIDEFSLQVDVESETIEDELIIEDIESSNASYILASKAFPDLTYELPLSITNQAIGEIDNSIEIKVLHNPDTCSHCSFKGTRYLPTFRRSLLGTPFYISNTVPTLLEFCQDDKNALDRPGRGRRLITFTDSRQGTARIATKIQQDSERNRVRGLVYNIAASRQNDGNSEERLELEAKLNKHLSSAQAFRAQGVSELADGYLELAKEIESKIKELSSDRPVGWDELVSSLQVNKDISVWMLDYYKDLNPVLFSETRGCRELIQMLLIREFAHRPKRHNSLETLGLVSVQYPALEKITTVPKEWETLKLNLSDWKDFLKICLDFYVRSNKFISIPKEWINWIGMNIYTKELLGPDSKELTSPRISKWPLLTKSSSNSNNNRLIRILAYALKLDIENPYNHDVINQIMRAAWVALTQLSGILAQTPGALTFQLKLEQLAFSCSRNAWICPNTHRLLDTAFRGITPYLPHNPNENSALCQKVNIPVFHSKLAPNSEKERLALIRQWCSEEPEIQQLRSENLWTDLSDRIIEGGQYFRTAEHSAQQPSYRLQQFEALFKEAKLNILSCSTTMEMGVDIGGISVVAMNNVPPHPANYLQRAGRAGRRQETRAMAFTICKDNPHERNVFAHSLWPFETHIKAPYITLNSSRIVQRHVNSLVLAYFLKHVLAVQEKEATKLNCGWFFCGDKEVKSLADKLCDWLEDCCLMGIPEKLRTGLVSLVKSSVLEGLKTTRFLRDTSQNMQKVRDQWLPEHDALQKELDSLSASIEEKNPYRRRLEKDLERLKGEYLLSELAARGFLPGYGFPTGIASFDPYSIHDYVRSSYKKQTESHRDDNISRIREKPGRDLSVAIREYAPGADIVLNGLAYRSAGITLNWHIPDGELAETQKIMVEWRCHKCGAIDHNIGSNFDKHCNECGEALRADNIREFIEPAGFAVDFYSSPTTDISTQQYVPVQEPWVVAKNSLMTLPNPELGMFRSSTEGHIFYHSSGEHGKGYAICMACGRAESITATNDFPKKLKPGEPHKKLRGAPHGEDEAWCNGAEKEFTIKHGLHLGYVDRTDVFELYLKWPGENNFLQHGSSQEDSKKIAWTLAVVLRQALADILGINNEELGYTVKPTTLSMCDYPVATIVLYDKCSGGAGFASSAPYHFEELFDKAKKYLNCPADCTGVCQNCLMGYDTRFHIDLLDRHLTLSFLNDDFMRRIALPDELKILGIGSHYSSETVFAEIRQAAGKGATELHIFLHGQPAQWEIAETLLLENLHSWREIYSKIFLLIGVASAKYLEDTVKEDLWVLSRLGIKIGFVNEKDIILDEQGCIVAQALSNSCCMTFAQSNMDSAVPAKDWLNSINNVLIYSNEYPVITIDSLLDETTLKPVSGPGDIEVEITKECNGLLREFGSKFWQLAMAKHSILKNHIDAGDELAEIHYSDRYLYSPWSLMLLGELIDGLRKAIGSAWSKPAISIDSGRKKPDNYQKNGLFADWLDDSFRLEIIEKYFEYMDEQCTAKALNDLPHGRLLALIWASGKSTSIRLDQGVGYWICEKSPWFKNMESPDEVVSNMMNLVGKLRVKNQKEFPTQVFIKERDHNYKSY